MANGNSTSEVQKVYAKTISRDKKPLHINNGVFTRPVHLLIHDMCTIFGAVYGSSPGRNKPFPHYHSANPAENLEEITIDIVEFKNTSKL